MLIFTWRILRTRAPQLTAADAQQPFLVQALLEQAANTQLDHVSNFTIRRLQMIPQGRVEDLLVIATWGKGKGGQEKKTEAHE